MKQIIMCLVLKDWYKYFLSYLTTLFQLQPLCSIGWKEDDSVMWIRKGLEGDSQGQFKGNAWY
jgi:hypothetical protein